VSTYSSGRRPAQFRFPEWAHVFVEERAAAYVARAAESLELSEAGLKAAEQSWPEW
jgi:hypothetical protein